MDDEQAVVYFSFKAIKEAVDGSSPVWSIRCSCNAVWYITFSVQHLHLVCCFCFLPLLIQPSALSAPQLFKGICCCRCVQQLSKIIIATPHPLTPTPTKTKINETYMQKSSVKNTAVPICRQTHPSKVYVWETNMVMWPWQRENQGKGGARRQK